MADCFGCAYVANAVRQCVGFALCFSYAFTCILRTVHSCSQRDCILSFIQFILENVGHIFGNSQIVNTDVPKPVCFHDDPQHRLICFFLLLREMRTKEPRTVVRATRANTTQDGTKSIHECCDEILFLLDADRCHRDASSRSHQDLCVHAVSLRPADVRRQTSSMFFPHTS